MKNRIGKKLFRGLTGMLIINMLIGITGLICILVLKNTSNNIVVEYVELDSVQELRLSLNQIVTPAYDYIYYKDENDLTRFEYHMNVAYSNINDCTIKLSNRHNKSVISDIEKQLKTLNSKVLSSSIIISKSEETHPLLHEIEEIIINITKDVESILSETKDEIEEYVIVYKTSSTHSIIAIIGFSILLLIIGSKWGAGFVKRIIDPIERLVQSTQIIAIGNLNERTNIKTGDELEVLGNSFNEMIDEIENLTVSRDYFDGIISGMFESLIVTNNKGEIITANLAACNLLSYTKDELMNQNISLIINDKDVEFKIKETELLNKGSNPDQEKEYITKNGEIIPVLFSCSVLKDRKSNFTGIIFIAHDLRERKKIEGQLRRTRNEQLISINEAQEKERLRIATEIHDSIGQMLTGISYSIENKFIERPENEKEYEENVIQLQKLIDNTIKESKNIAHDLIPILLKDFGLVVATENLISDIQSKHGLKINFEAFNFSDRLDSKLEKALYRVLQEAINNIIKHSNATESNIHIIKHSDAVSIVIEDNGIGFEKNKINFKTKQKGIGLISMKERVNAFDGFITFNSVKNQGTEIVIDIPINK